MNASIDLICLLICQIRSIGEASEDLRRWHLEDDGLHHAGEHGDLNQEEQGLWQNFMKTTMHLFRGSKPCSLGDRNMCRLLPAWHKFLAHCTSFDLSVQQPGSAETGSICHWMQCPKKQIFAKQSWKKRRNEIQYDFLHFPWCLHSLAVHLPILCHVSASQRLEIAPLDRSGSPTVPQDKPARHRLGNSWTHRWAQRQKCFEWNHTVCYVWRCQNHSKSALSTFIYFYVAPNDTVNIGELCMNGTLQWLRVDLLLPHPVWNLDSAMCAKYRVICDFIFCAHSRKS